MWAYSKHNMHISLSALAGTRLWGAARPAQRRYDDSISGSPTRIRGTRRADGPPTPKNWPTATAAVAGQRLAARRIHGPAWYWSPAAVRLAAGLGVEKRHVHFLSG